MKAGGRSKPRPYNKIGRIKPWTKEQCLILGKRSTLQSDVLAEDWYIVG